MSGRIGVAAIATEEALAAAATETLIQLVAATNHAIKLQAWGVFFTGVVVTGIPIRVQILRQTTAGTSSALTIVKWDDSQGDTFDTTGLQDFSAEPTAGDMLHPVLVHPQSGYEVLYPLGHEIQVGAGDRIGLRVITPTGVNPNVVAYMRFEE